MTVPPAGQQCHSSSAPPQCTPVSHEFVLIANEEPCPTHTKTKNNMLNGKVSTTVNMVDTECKHIGGQITK